MESREPGAHDIGCTIEIASVVRLTPLTAGLVKIKLLLFFFLEASLLFFFSSSSLFCEILSISA